MPAKLVLVNGLSGTRKTTLAKKLAADLMLPLIQKDEFKEFFYDKLDIKNREESQLVGKIAFELLYILIEQYAGSSKDLMIESPFFASFARPKLKSILAGKKIDLLEIYCVLPEPIRRERIMRRLKDRHPQHFAEDIAFDKNETELAEQYAPLKIGKFIEVSTEHFAEAEYQILLKRIRAWISP